MTNMMTYCYVKESMDLMIWNVEVLSFTHERLLFKKIWKMHQEIR